MPRKVGTLVRDKPDTIVGDKHSRLPGSRAGASDGNRAWRWPLEDGSSLLQGGRGRGCVTF